VPEDAGQIPYVLNAFIETRLEGALVTTHKLSADWFKSTPNHPVVFDENMSTILGYPEAKPDVAAACSGRPVANARAVQARDGDDWVIHEAWTSPGMLDRTVEDLGKYVPPGGRLVVLTPVEAIARRLLLREAGK
jgi:hypothetical protein